MTQTLPRQGAPLKLPDGRTVYNAWCHWCDRIDTGTVTDLVIDRGWTGDLRCCVECAPPVQPMPEPWPSWVRVMSDPFPDWVYEDRPWEDDA